MGRTVGVIIPAYNAESVISQALASVAAQERPADMVVVVDDGSQDQTSRLVKDWANRLPLKLIRLDENRGSGLARSAGLAEMDTELVAMLDADDYWLPDHLQVMTETHEEHGGLITACYLDGGRALPSGNTACGYRPPRNSSRNSCSATTSRREHSSNEACTRRPAASEATAGARIGTCGSACWRRGLA